MVRPKLNGCSRFIALAQSLGANIVNYIGSVFVFNRSEPRRKNGRALPLLRSGQSRGRTLANASWRRREIATAPFLAIGTLIGSTSSAKAAASLTNHPLDTKFAFGLIGADRIKSSLGDVRNFGAICDGVTDCEPAVASALAAGYRRILLPPNSFYQPVANTVPAGIEFVGEDWETSIISVADRTIDDLLLGSKAVVRNVGIISRFGDASGNPANTQKTCPLGFGINLSDGPRPLCHYAYEQMYLWSGPQITGPDGVVHTDIPLIDATTSAPGADAIYAEARGPSASALRVVTSASRSRGILVLHGYTGTDLDEGVGLHIVNYLPGTSNRYSQRIERRGDSVSLFIDDMNKPFGTNMTDVVRIAVAKQSSGDLLNIYQTTAGYSGNAINLNVGNNFGRFAGRFLSCKLAGVEKMYVDSIGRIEALAATHDAIRVDGKSGFARGMVFSTSRLDRFQIGITGAAEEDNGGANFYIRHCNDEGGVLGDALTIQRETGRVFVQSLAVRDDIILPSFTVSSLPSPRSAGQLIYVSDESGGAVVAFSDGEAWRRVTDRAVLS